MRIAVLADIHGNLAALQAVMAEIEHLQPDHVLLNGDLINGAPFSAEVVDIVCRKEWIVVRGNHEFYYLDFGTPRAVKGSNDASRWGQLRWLVERMTPAHAAYLGMLPDERTFYIPGTQPLGIAHGVPGRNRVGFYNEQSDTAMSAELQLVTVPTFISAHSHVQVDRHVSSVERIPMAGANGANGTGHEKRHWHVINPGSVGLPLTGNTAAHFSMIESVPEYVESGGWRTTHLKAAYDRRPMLEAYESTGMAEAGGVFTQLFYWTLVTAEPEIINYYQWARTHGYDGDDDTDEAFRAYCDVMGREWYVRQRDPLYHRHVR